MATSKQEQTYNKVIEYYSLADQLIRAVEDSSHKLSSDQFEIIEDMVHCLETCADEVTTQYIDFVKNGESEELTDNIRQSLNKIPPKLRNVKIKS